MSVYDYNVTLEDGTTYSLNKYRGQPLVIVNTATKCGFAPQFKRLEELYQQFQADGLVILGFPSNQFKQEVTSSEAAAQACRTTYGVSFPMHAINNVNGEKALPLFDYLTQQAPGAIGSAIKWNFTKFLINRDGHVVRRYAPKTNPLKMVTEIEKVV